MLSLAKTNKVSHVFLLRFLPFFLFCTVAYEFRNAPLPLLSVVAYLKRGVVS
jgi:hypothetical protein